MCEFLNEVSKFFQRLGSKEDDRHTFAHRAGPGVEIVDGLNEIFFSGL